MQLFSKWLGVFMHAKADGSSFQNSCAKDVAAKLMKFTKLIKHVSNMFLHIPKFLIQRVSTVLMLFLSTGQPLLS